VLALVCNARPTTGSDVMPCAGKPDKFKITSEMVGLWRETYPAVDVDAQIRAAVQWCQDNPTTRKTASAARGFLGSWMSRAQYQSRRK
jgi:hypothetical protein